MTKARAFLIAAALGLSSIATSCDRGDAETSTFTNSRKTAVAPDLQDSYIDFAFDYPKTWTINPKTGTPGFKNFVEVKRPRVNEIDTETFAVGYLKTGPKLFENPVGDVSLSSLLMGDMEAELLAQFPNSRVVSRGEAVVAGRRGTDFRVEAKFPEIQGEPVTMWIRIISLPPQLNQEVGAMLAVTATNKAPEITSAADLGEKGEASVAVRSFRFR